MDPPEPQLTSESAALAVIEGRLRRWQGVTQVLDDCGKPQGRTDLVTSDALVEGVHFDRSYDTLRQIGAQAAVANLSDLAASGAAPVWLTWSLILPAGITAADLGALTDGFASVCTAAGARIVGGNLTRSRGPLTIAVTAGGALLGSRVLDRSGAQPGDGLFVSGTLGRAAAGWRWPQTHRAARHHWRAHLNEARLLAGHGAATACMDISDGLLLDAARMARASGVHFALTSKDIPVLHHGSEGDALELALGGGEDYVLLFTASSEALPWPWAHRIGQCQLGSGLSLDGVPCAPRGYDHFGGAQ